MDKVLPLSIKKYIKLSIQFIEHTIFNIFEEKKSTIFRKKPHFFLEEKKVTY